MLIAEMVPDLIFGGFTLGRIHRSATFFQKNPAKDLVEFYSIWLKVQEPNLYALSCFEYNLKFLSPNKPLASAPRYTKEQLMDPDYWDRCLGSRNSEFAKAALEVTMEQTRVREDERAAKMKEILSKLTPEDVEFLKQNLIDHQENVW